MSLSKSTIWIRHIRLPNPALNTLWERIKHKDGIQTRQDMRTPRGPFFQIIWFVWRKFDPSMGQLLCKSATSDANVVKDVTYEPHDPFARQYDICI